MDPREAFKAKKFYVHDESQKTIRYLITNRTDELGLLKSVTDIVDMVVRKKLPVKELFVRRETGERLMYFARKHYSERFDCVEPLQSGTA